jgi:succinate dehydrogenase / fumarate reductase flavoprotein subunit
MALPSLSEMDVVEHDVLVIGAGGAGIRAAIECSLQGLNTAVVCKSLLGKAHTVMAEGGAAAALGNVSNDPKTKDSWKIHFRDTMRGGKFLNNWRMAELHAQQAPDRIRELEEWGAVFDRTKDGKISQRPFGGHRFPRLAHTGDRTGLELIRTLQDKLVAVGTQVYMECKALKLLMDGNRVAGAVCLWRDSGKFLVVRAKAVILATGGAGKGWRITSNSWEYTGDGQWMAYQAGAELIDMEFTQFHPTGMVWPPSVRGILVTEGVRGEGGILLNNKGERFMFKYVPPKFAAETADTVEEAEAWLAGKPGARRPPELLTRDVVAKAINAEVNAGRGSPHGGAFLDIASRRDADYIKKKLPSMYHQFKELAQVDITKEPMEVGPTLHYMMGGIRVEADSQMTRVPGLFAAGECSGGMHGANRLGGNSLSDLLVFGRLAGVGAKNYLQTLQGAPQVDEKQVHDILLWATGFLNRESGKNPYVLHDELREVMGRYVGIWRDKAGLEQGVQELQKLTREIPGVKAEGSSQFNPGWHEALDMEPLMLCSEAVARSALMREESRGGHSREDFPEEEKEWQKYNIVIRKAADGSMEIEKYTRPEPPAELAKIANSKIEDLEAGLV